MSGDEFSEPLRSLSGLSMAYRTYNSPGSSTQVSRPLFSLGPNVTFVLYSLLIHHHYFPRSHVHYELPWNYSKPRFSGNWGQSYCSLTYSVFGKSDQLSSQTRLNFYITIFITALIPPSESTTELLDSLYLNAIFYGLAILITALVQTIQRQLDLYHAIIVMQLMLSLQFLHGFGAICVLVRISYIVLISGEYRNEEIYLGQNNRLQNEDDYRHSDSFSRYLLSLVVLRVEQRLAIRRAARMQRPCQIRPCFLHLSSDRSLGTVLVYDNPRHDHVRPVVQPHGDLQRAQGLSGRPGATIAGKFRRRKGERTCERTKELGEEYVEEV